MTNNEVKVALLSFLQRVVNATQVYIDQNDRDGFIHAVWQVISADLPDTGRLYEEYRKVGFKSNELMRELDEFQTAKSALDHVLKIIFDALIQDTDEGYRVLGEKLLLLGHVSGTDIDNIRPLRSQ